MTPCFITILIEEILKSYNEKMIKNIYKALEWQMNKQKLYYKN